MKHLGTVVPIILLLGSMKLIEHKALTSAVHQNSISFRTHIEADIDDEPVLDEKPYYYSLIPVTLLEIPEPEISFEQDEQDTELIDSRLITKLKKLYVLRRIIANNQPTDIAPDYQLEEESMEEESIKEVDPASNPQLAYSIDAIPCESALDAESAIITQVRELISKLSCGEYRLQCITIIIEKYNTSQSRS